MKSTLMSSKMFSFLHELVENGKIPEELMNELDQRTFAAVLNRKYVVDHLGFITLTRAGLDAHDLYMLSGIPKRKEISDLSNLVKQLLHIKHNKKVILINEKPRQSVSTDFSRSKKSINRS